MDRDSHICCGLPCDSVCVCVSVHARVCVRVCMHACSATWLTFELVDYKAQPCTSLVAASAECKKNQINSTRAPIETALKCVQQSLLIRTVSCHCMGSVVHQL